jgi:hypothetical protein
MFKLFLVVLCLSFNLHAKDQGTMPAICAADCSGQNPITPTDYKKKANGVDPINGGKLGATIKVESEEGSGKTEEVPSDDFLNQLNDFENFSASQCGQGLGDDSKKEIVIGEACSNKLLNRSGINFKLSHLPKGDPFPSLNIINKFFEAASSPQAQDNLKKLIYISNDGIGINSLKCQKYVKDVGSKDTLMLVLGSTMCRHLYIPKIAPQTVMVGLPVGTTTYLEGSYTLKAQIFGIPINILSADTKVNAPLSDVPSARTSFYRAGSFADGLNLTEEKISKDQAYTLLEYIYSQDITVPIGPLEITIEVGAKGSLKAGALVRATRLWANTDVYVNPKLDGWISGSIGFWIARAGVEGNLNIVNQQLHNYGFSALAGSPVPGNPNTWTFFFSEQMSNIDSISGLSGNINVFAKIRVPKFLGMKWKKYSKNVYSWKEGFSAQGYLWSLARGPVMTNKLYNDYLNSDNKLP